MQWEFLTDTISGDSLLLDCRSVENYDTATLTGSVGVSLVKKPFGSGPRSLSLLSDLIGEIEKLAKGKSDVICFDEGQGMYACRMAWLLRSSGLKNVKVYAKKFQDISPEEIGKGSGSLQPESKGQVREVNGIVTVGYLQKNLVKVQLLDTRTPEEYNGVVPRMSNHIEGALCGRIPGSMNWDWRKLYGKDGYLREKLSIIGEIRKIGLIQERPTVIYDYNGARSCTTALVLSSCGYKHVSVYLGSWMEWQKTDLPKQNFRTWRR